MYIVEADVNSFLGISGETTLVNSLIAQSEALFNNLVGSKAGILDASNTDVFEHQTIPNGQQDVSEIGRVFYLKRYKPTDITTIDGVDPGTLGTDYIIEGQKLTLKTALSYPSAFPYRHTIVYKAGEVSVPEDVKNACLFIVGGMYTARNTQGVGSFRQDLLSVNYAPDNNVLTNILSPDQSDFLKVTVRKYSVPFVIS